MYTFICSYVTTDSAANVSIEELINLDILADKHHRKIWLLDLLMKVRTSTERLPCLDYDTPLYYAVKRIIFNLCHY